MNPFKLVQKPDHITTEEMGNWVVSVLAENNYPMILNISAVLSPYLIINLINKNNIKTPVTELFIAISEMYYSSNATRSMTVILKWVNQGSSFALKTFIQGLAHYNKGINREYIEEFFTDNILDFKEEVFNACKQHIPAVYRFHWENNRNFIELKKAIEELRYMPGSLEAREAAKRFSASLPTSF